MLVWHISATESEMLNYMVDRRSSEYPPRLLIHKFMLMSECYYKCLIQHYFTFPNGYN